MTNSIAFGKAPRREAGNQPMRQSVSQAVGQAIRQAERRAETHNLAFFFFSCHTVGNPRHTKSIGDRAVKHPVFASIAVGLNPIQGCRRGTANSLFFFIQPWFKSFSYMARSCPPPPLPRRYREGEGRVGGVQGGGVGKGRFGGAHKAVCGHRRSLAI